MDEANRIARMDQLAMAAKVARETKQPQLMLLPDSSGVIVSMPDAMPAQFRMTLPQIEALLDSFGCVRAHAVPAVPERWTTGTIVNATRTSLALETNMMTGETLLHIRDEGFGWLHYTLSRETAREFGLALIARADAPMPAGGSA